jgi:hypothetical protein
MALNIPPPKQLAIIISVALMIGGCAELVRQYALLPEPTTEYCWYEVKYLHVSGKEITKPIMMDCNGFTEWVPGYSAEVPYMRILFNKSEPVEIYGATDILSIAKKQDQ